MTLPAVAVITYRRPAYLAKCLEQVRKHSKADYRLVVACDSPDDADTAAVCAAFNAPLIRGGNRGVVWNKNRALYYFMSRTAFDPIILLEDDTYPVSDTWLQEWVDAARRWHHVNFSHPGLLAPSAPPIGGEGTAEHPHIHRLLTGQCTVVSRKAMETAGYLDTRFRGYGHGHVEWTKRHNELLFANKISDFPSGPKFFLSIVGGLKVEDAPSFRSDPDIERNRALLRDADLAPRQYRDPWSSNEEREALVKEIHAIVPFGKSELNALLFSFSTSDIHKACTFKACVDSISLGSFDVTVRGWAFNCEGAPADYFSVSIAGKTIQNPALTRNVRPDVTRHHPESSPACGFELTFALPTSTDAELPIRIFAHACASLKGQLIYTGDIKNTRLNAEESLSRWSGKNLYFGNIYPHEKQYKTGNFIGLALTPKFDLDISHNVYEKFPIPDSSVAKIQAQDVFEHLEYGKIPSILDEIYRVLAPGGIFRLSVPDYRSPVLKARSVYDEDGNVVADLMMGGSVSYDASTRRRKVTFLTNGDSHLWFPLYEKIKDLISRSKFKDSEKIVFYHYFSPDGGFVRDDFPENDMPVTRAPPFDMRANGLPVSIIVDFFKTGSRLAETRNSKLKSQEQHDHPADIKLRETSQLTMLEAEFSVFARHYSNATRIVEFGAGSSTLFAAEKTKAKICSVESDRTWIEKLRTMPAISSAEAEGRLHFIHVDIGPTGAWGQPTDDSAEKLWRNYPKAPWQIMTNPDLVFVDGRFRVACILAAILNTRPRTHIMVHDFWNRSEYHAALPFLTCEERAETLGVFRRRWFVNRHKIRMMFRQYRHNPQ